MRRSPLSTIISVLALVVSLGGTAIAADHYIITSTSQIKPSVLRALQKQPEARVSALATAGVHSVVARVRSTAPVTTVSEPGEVNIPLMGASWTQRGEEVDELIGRVIVSRPGSALCGSTQGSAVGSISVDGQAVGEFITSDSEEPSQDISRSIEWDGEFGADEAKWLFEPGKTVTHKLTATVYDTCKPSSGSGHFVIDSIAVDVLAAK